MSHQPAAMVRTLPLRLLLDEALRLARRQFLRLYPPVAVPVGLAAALMAVAQGSIMGFGSVHGPSDPSLGSLAGFGAAFLVYVLVLGLGNAVMLAGASAVVSGRHRQGWAWALRPRVCGTLLLYAVVVGLASLACCLPGLAVGAVLGLVVPVMVVEGVHGTAAFRRSAELMLHHPERVLHRHPVARLAVIGFVGYLLSYAVSLAVQMPFAVAFQVVALRAMAGAQGGADLETAWLLLQVPQTVLGALASQAVGLYMCCAVALFHADACRRREGADLEAALDALGAPP